MSDHRPAPVRVGVVDDQPLLVSAFAALIDHEDDLEVVGTGADGLEAVALATDPPLAIDVLVLDIRMPRLDGVEATRRIVAAGDRPRILVLTTFNVDELVVGAVSAGARGFLLKDAGPGELVEAIRGIHRGEAVIASQAAPALLTALRRPDLAAAPTDDPAPGAAEHEADPVIASLTPREVEVLHLVARGRTNAEIAAELFIAPTTVKTHVGNLLLKLDARDRIALVVLAHTVGLVGAGDRSIPLDIPRS